MSCVISIIGKDLDIDDFVLKSKLKGLSKSYKGEIINATKPNGKKLEYSFVSGITSKANFNDFGNQLKDTIRYLKRNKSKLEYISMAKNVEYATLNFGMDSQIDNDQRFVQTILLPKDLLILCGQLGLDIELSIYRRFKDK